MCLSCEDTAGQIFAMVPKWRFFATFLRPVFSASRVHHVSDLHLSMADIQSATAEIRRGKKEKKKIEETTGQKYNGLSYYIGRP